MTNFQVYVFISICSVLFIGAWSISLAVMLEKSRKTIEQQKRLIAELVKPPF